MESGRKVAFITGVARGQGRAHAVKLASRGMDIVGLDICEDIESMDYPNATEDDLRATVKAVEAAGGSIVAEKGDVRSFDDLRRVLDHGVERFGRVDVLLANAGIIRLSPGGDRDRTWTDIIDVNLTGVWRTIEVVLPAIRAGQRGGSIVITSSVAGLKGGANDKAGGQAYTAAKRGLVGLMQVLANEYAGERIRVNTIHPTGVLSGMTQNPAMEALHAQAARGEQNPISQMRNALPIDILQAEDIANAVAWLVSDEAAYITGVQLPLDAGFAVR
ncbi:mycofactocin-coupled SDR family oxidoreductase [Streptomyces sp. MBT53]|uniref:mycofactocin-coupled SDR family oxidoreductase n=1 Tax=Streptomyces sp. MBT53 TaxID=1488384 RepID=UPI001911A7F4|nr:mycofactocin-coupled SDR family oxidoreductase [Streptomyces sp. MBT53]MBK6009768.1 mycofactocin-coupled SDR family oxidoreductase [Streptomyces sp. MBT53]